MSDFLANLAGRALGITPAVQPRETSIFAATAAPRSDLWGVDPLGSANPNGDGDAAQMDELEEWGRVQPDHASTAETASFPAATDDPTAHSRPLSRRQVADEGKASATRSSVSVHSAEPDTWTPAQIDATRRGQALDARQGQDRAPLAASPQAFDDPAPQGEASAQEVAQPNHGLHANTRQPLPTAAERSHATDQKNRDPQPDPSPQVRNRNAEQHASRLRTQPQAPFSTPTDDPSPPAQRLSLLTLPPVPTRRITDGEERAVEGPLPTHAPLLPSTAAEQPTAVPPVRLLPEQARPVTAQPLYAQAEQLSQAPLSRPVIHISIGRIDVRALHPPTPPTQPSVPVAPVLSLNDYLHSFKSSER